MKLLVLSAVTTFLVFASASQGTCQEAKTPPGRPHLRYTTSARLHFVISPTESTGRVELIASRAQRDLSEPGNLSSTDTESVLQLRGNVEVMMCSLGGHGCDNGSMVLYADGVNYNEKTHEIDAHGNVRIEPYRNQPHIVIPR